MKKSKLTDFTKDYSSKFKTKLLKQYKDIAEGFGDQNERAEAIKDYWDIYNCQLNSRQFYDGNSQIFVPIVTDAVDAIVTRYSNQVFPKNGRYIEVVTENGERAPYAQMALTEHYIEKSNLREIIPALIRQGQVEGQYTIAITWRETKRQVTYRVTTGLDVDGEEVKGIDDFDDVREEEVTDSWPELEIIPDCDFIVLPATCDSLNEALDKGGSVTTIQRLTKTKIQEYIDEEIFNEKKGNELLASFGKANNLGRNTKKDLAHDAGIKTESGKQYALVYRTWQKIDGKLYLTYYGGEKTILSCKRNPYWCDKIDIISAPVKKLGGVIKGISPIQKVQQMQYAANDAANMGMDSAAFSLMPIVLTDPEKNPRVGSMVLNLAAIWETSPKDTQIVNFPPLWKDAFEMIGGLKNEIFQALSVNPAMIPNSSGGKKKMNQAEVANEQQVDLLTTADAVTVLEKAILTPIAERFFEYDHQFRDTNIWIKQFGELGVQAQMEEITPTEMTERYKFKWFGVEAARSAQQVQQQIAAINVMRGIPPQLYPGKKLDITPIMEILAENAFGPRLAPKVFQDMKDKLSLNPELENQMLENGFDVAVHEYDDDAAHLKSHAEAMQAVGDISGNFRTHIIKHQMQIQQKTQSMQGAPGGAPGVPGGAAPGVPGLPKPGSQPQAPAGAKGPAGAVRPDSMQDPSKMPRHF